METTTYFLHPQKLVLGVVIMVCLVMMAVFSGVQNANGSSVQSIASNPAIFSTPPKAPKIPARTSTVLLGSAFLDLNQLATLDSIDESDNARWSLVRGTPEESQVYDPANGVDWEALRQVTASGSYRIPAGTTWSFNSTFADGPGFKIASGVLAGGHCALATVFRAAAIQANLPTRAIPHRWPIPGFPLNETVTIWWGRNDLLIQNFTTQALDLAWALSPGGIEINILQVK